MKYNDLISNTLEYIGCPVSFADLKLKEKPDIYVTFFNLPSKGKFYANDEEKAREYHIQVDIWCKLPNSYQETMESIIEKLTNVGFIFLDGPELHEQEINTIHKVLEFKIVDEERMI